MNEHEHEEVKDAQNEEEKKEVSGKSLEREKEQAKKEAREGVLTGLKQVGDEVIVPPKNLGPNDKAIYKVTP